MSCPQTAAAPQRILCVLGMHRSGTSCLTGSLQEAGLFLGDCHTWNPHNLKGNRENQQIVDINDAVLAANEGAWDAPPRTVQWSEAHRRAARELLAGYAGHPYFGFKDPRTLLALSGWQALFPDMDFIGIFRHPLKVAESLHTRSGMHRQQGLELWYQYNLRLLQHYRRRSFPLLCFDDEQAVFMAKLHRVLSGLGFDAGQWRGEFYEPALKTAEPAEPLPLPWKVRRVYEKLQRLAE